jgi:hypothetical protein
VGFAEQTDSVVATLTHAGRNAMARSILGEISVKLTSFQVGRGGYDLAIPVKVVPVVAADTALQDPVPDSRSRRPFVLIEQPIGSNVLAPICRLDIGDVTADYGLGELGIFATVERDVINPATVGLDFLFAIAHFPILSKTPSHTLLWRVIIAL